MKKTVLILALILSAAIFMTACSNTPSEASPASVPSASEISTLPSAPDASETPVSSPAAETQTTPLEGHTLSVYCGAGMTKPFQEVADAFSAQSGCKIEVTYANAAQIQTQINTTNEGDLFIAGSADEMKPVQDAVTESVDLVKHIPVLAVKAGNPLNITMLSDLAKDGVRVVLGDMQSTPIGKIADKALSDTGVLDIVDVVARTATAPEIFNALVMDQCDAIIVWKENVKSDDILIVDTAEMDKYIKTVPAASLSYCDDTDALTAFLDFLNSDDAKNIWAKYGYEVLN